jgi:hypothetical protein
MPLGDNPLYLPVSEPEGPPADGGLPANGEGVSLQVDPVTTLHRVRCLPTSLFPDDELN